MIETRAIQWTQVLHLSQSVLFTVPIRSFLLDL